MRTWWHRVGGYSACAAVLLCVVALALGACSTSNLGGLSLTGLGGLGSPALAPTGTPTLQGSDPGGTYAFVYGDQVWIKNAQDKAPHQLTHLALSASITYSWGPIVWSSDASHLAFALGQDQLNANPSGYGALYIVDASSGDTQLTAGTSSIYGHTYAWYGANALFYANGSGIQFYDFSNPGDPRPFTAVVGSNGPDYTGNGDPSFMSFGDVAFDGQRLYATRMDVASLGGSGTVGTAGIWSYYVPVAGADYAGGSMGISRYGLSGYQVQDLGQAYANSHGVPTAGAWAISQGGGIVFDQVTSADAQSGTIKSTVCYGYNIGGCDQSLFQDVSSFSRDARPQLAFTSDGKTIAFGGPNISIESRTGSGFTKLSPGAIGQPPQWSPDDSTVAATQPVAATSAGQQQATTNIVTANGGKTAVLIAGAQGLSWAPQG